MMYIGQPIKLVPSGELRIYLGLNMCSKNPNGSTVTMKEDGTIEEIDTFTSHVRDVEREWNYTHLEDENKRPVVKFFSEGNLGFFGCIKDFKGYESLKNEMIEYLKELNDEHTRM